jgi:hypothetical protein
MTQSPPPLVQPPPGPPAPRTNGLAIASLVLGVIALPGSFGCCCFGLEFVPAVLAAIFGHVALSQIKRSQGQMDGRGMAIAGLVCGYAALAIGVAITLLWFLLATCSHGHPDMFYFKTIHPTHPW